MSWKNKLQEYCQQNHIDLPIYNVTPILSDGIIMFKATVAVNGKVFDGSESPTKRGTESSAAEVAYKSITECNYYHVIYVIDLENNPYFARDYDECILYVGCISSTHNSIRKYSNWKRATNRDFLQQSKSSNKLLYTIDGGYKDLVDHLMTLLMSSVASYVSRSKANTKVVIATSDQSGMCNKRCLKLDSEYLNVRYLIDSSVKRL